MALRDRRPGRPTSTETTAQASAPAPSTEATQALTGEEAATIRKITALQSGRSGSELGPQGRMARLSSLQSMLVANLVAIQRELTERHADLRRHMDSLHLPAEHRAQGGQAAKTLLPEAANTPAPPVHSTSTTTGPMRRRYRRPPALRARKPPVPAEDKEQAARDNKVSYRTLYKKRVSVTTGKPRFGQTLSTSATTTTTTTISTSASSTTIAATTAAPIGTTTTPFFDHQTTADEPSATTKDVVEITTASEVQEDPTAPSTVPTTEEATGVTEALSTTSESYPSSPEAVLSTPKTDLEAAEASTDASADFTAEGSAPAPVAAALSAAAAAPLPVPVVAASLPGAADLLGFQASPRDPVHRPGRSRLTLLGGVLPEEDPAAASALFGLDRHGRGAFRAPLRMEAGFVPMIPGSASSLQQQQQQPAGAPQIVGPIPGGYRDVLRGSPVQLDLPRLDKPSDFLGRPVSTAPAPAPAPAALPPRFVKRVMGAPLIRTAAVAAPLRQG